MPVFVGKAPAATTQKLFAFNADGDVWNGSAYVAWVDANYATYKVATTEESPGRFYATLPAGVSAWELATDGLVAAHDDNVNWTGPDLDTSYLTEIAAAKTAAEGALAAVEGIEGGGSPVISPIHAVVSNPRYTTKDMAPIFAGSSPADAWTITDATGAPIDLSDKTLRFLVSTPVSDSTPCNPFDDTFTAAWSVESADITISGDDDNVVTVQQDGADVVAGDHRYWLLNVTDRVVLATGKMPVKPIGPGAWAA